MPVKDHLIFCDREEFSVTANLFDALSHLRYFDRPRVLWVDALCINQADVSERNRQVAHMLTIYQAASRVI